jgi:hypothetical protein
MLDFINYFNISFLSFSCISEIEIIGAILDTSIKSIANTDTPAKVRAHSIHVGE